MAKLAVNIDHIATIRQARRGKEPDPIWASVIVELGGADGIIVHLREDRRHIQLRDLEILSEVVKTKLNLEMALTNEMIEIAKRIKPDMVTIVPEKREELTTESGLDVTKPEKRLKEGVKELAKIPISLFIDPEPKQIKASRDIGVNCIEINTGKYSESKNIFEQDSEFKRIEIAIGEAKRLGLIINAGHGLNYINIKRVANIKEIEEFNIGHSIVSRAVFVGLDRAVREMKDLIK